MMTIGLSVLLPGCRKRDEWWLNIRAKLVNASSNKAAVYWKPLIAWGRCCSGPENKEVKQCAGGRRTKVFSW